MNTFVTPINEPTQAVCPHMPRRLHVPLRRRMVVQDRMIDGSPAVVLYYGDKEVAFDEPSLFAFARAIAGHDDFTEAEARSWAPDADAQTLIGCLDTLLAEGILAVGARPQGQPGLRYRASPLPEGSHGKGRSWATDAAQIGRELLGEPIAPGHLELAIPVFRLAHPALDADDRQVGEANVFPRALRLDRPTEWQVCTYSGTRHMADRPMNVTALKAMRVHWPEMMAALAVIRAAYMRRCGLGDAPLTLGQIERLAVAVLSVPTWALMKPQGPVANGDLDPALSSLFRVTDGLRMAAHQMMFVPVGEPVTSPDQVVSATQFHDFAERAMSFHSETGVCAGPAHFVAEFLAVLIEGKAPVLGALGQIGPAMAAALSDLDAAMDYGFQALAIHAAAFSFWPHMGAAYQNLASLAAQMPEGLGPRAVAFVGGMADLEQQLQQQTYLGRSDWRQSRLQAYDDMYANARAAGRLPALPALSAVLAGMRDQTAPVAKDMGVAVTRVFPDLDPKIATDMATVLAEFALQTQAHLRLAGKDQVQLANRLNRPKAPAFTARDLTLHTRLQGEAAQRLPFLPDSLEALTGIRLTIGPTHIAAEVILPAIPQSSDLPVDICAQGA